MFNERRLADGNQLAFQVGGNGCLVDVPESAATFVGKRGKRSEGNVHVVRQFPHRTRRRIHDQEADETTKNEVSEIPAINVGRQLDNLGSLAFLAEFDVIFRGLEEAAFRGKGHARGCGPLIDRHAVFLYHDLAP